MFLWWNKDEPGVPSVPREGWSRSSAARNILSTREQLLVTGPRDVFKNKNGYFQMKLCEMCAMNVGIC